ncbi:MAG TPA: FtsX-like permease family protein, partial [Aliiroseovarius sp.]|nr:FtsX-like permease family protein [Aliiroseovarius sp.]
LTYRFASDDERAWLSANTLETSEVADFRSMVVTEGGARALTQAKAVDGTWPLYGAPELAPDMPLSVALKGKGGLPGVVMDPLLIARLGISPGDEVRLGGQSFVLMAALLREPDNATAAFSLGPRSLVGLGAAKDSAMLAPGTLFTISYRMRLAPGTDLDALEAQAAENIAGARWRDARNGVPSLRFFVNRLGTFLVLIGLAGLAIGGVGISAALSAYLADKTETIAVLKTLGADRSTLFLTYGLQVAALTALGLVMGLLAGAVLPWLLGPLFTAALPVTADFTPRIAPLIEAAIYGALVAALFTLWPLARIQAISPAALFRNATGAQRQARPLAFLLSLALLAALIGFAVWRTHEPKLVLWSALGVLAAAGLLRLMALLTRLLARRLAHARLVRGRPGLRLSLAALGSRGGELSATMLSLGLGLSVLAAIGQIDNNMRGAIQRELPGIAPAFFVLNIQPDQMDEIRARLDANPEVSRMDAAPMLRGVITKINDHPAQEVAGDHWVLRGDRGVTYSEEVPARTRVVAGKWWEPGYTGPPQISFGAEEAAEMGLKLGDTLTINILGRDITGTISSFREVDFSGAGMGFVLSMNPAALAGAPHSNIASIYATKASEANLLRELSEAYPNITMISVRSVIERVTGLMGSIAAAIAYGAVVTLVTGLVVLIGAAAAGERARRYEAALLKTLGATRARILATFALRTALTGAVAGLVAIAAGSAAGWAVTRFAMEQDFTFEPISAIMIVLGGV